MKKLPYARRNEILEILKKHDYVGIKNLSQQFDVSYMTIHRDIEEMEKSGEVFRVYGGVKIAGQAEQSIPEETVVLGLSKDLTIEERFNVQLKSKQLIAKKAASFVQEGDTIGMDPSTTTLHMCTHISKMNITVVTNSIMVALQFSSSPAVKVIVLGGSLRKSSLTLSNYGLVEGDMGIYLDKCFISAKALSYEEGLTDLTMEEPYSKRHIINQSSSVFVLADHTKIGKVSSFRVIRHNLMTGIITDSKAKMSSKQIDVISKYKDSGVNVFFAED